VRLFGDALGSFLTRRTEIRVVATVESFSQLREVLADHSVDLVLIDVSQGIDFEQVREIAAYKPGLALLALGLKGAQEAVRCGRAGFAGYVTRDASFDALLCAMRDAVAGRLVCAPEVAGELLRALYREQPEWRALDGASELTPRECDVLRHVGYGRSNKEIARELNLSISTVKHHVHSILEKLQVARRAQAMRKLRDTPWIIAGRETPDNREAPVRNVVPFNDEGPWPSGEKLRTNAS
jgi:DNA-binding NarL/FixJ family response regulator